MIEVKKTITLALVAEVPYPEFDEGKFVEMLRNVEPELLCTGEDGRVKTASWSHGSYLGSLGTKDPSKGFCSTVFLPQSSYISPRTGIVAVGEYRGTRGTWYLFRTMPQATSIWTSSPLPPYIREGVTAEDLRQAEKERSRK